MRHIALACIRPPTLQEKKIPKVVGKNTDQCIIVTNPTRDTQSFIQLDRVCSGYDETGRVLDEVQEQLLNTVLMGKDAALCVIGGIGSGKSRNILGALLKFADSFFHAEAIRVMQVAIIQIYDEQMYDLLGPPVTCISGEDPTYSLARNREDFLKLVAGALSVKAALSLQVDMFLQCAHMHVHCVCICQNDPCTKAIPRNAVSFIEIGSKALSRGNDTNIFDPELFSVEQSLVSLHTSNASTCGRLVAAHICSSLLTTRLVDILTKKVQTIWLGCISPSLFDIDQTEITLKFLVDARYSRRNRVRLASISQKFSSMFMQASPSNLTWHERVKTTAECTFRRSEWLSSMGLNESHARHDKGLGFVSISSDASISGHLFVLPHQRKMLAFGCATCVQPSDSGDFIRLGSSGILSLHCNIFINGDHSVVVEPSNGATVCINGQDALSVNCSIKSGDHILLGQCALFVLDAGAHAEDIWYQQKAWDLATQGLHHQASRYISPYFSLGAEWQKWIFEKQLLVLSTMVFEANCVAKELQRDTRFNVKVVRSDLGPENVSLCVMVTSGINDVADTWSVNRMSHQVARIRRLRTKFRQAGSFGTTSLPNSGHPFYELPSHQLVGIGFVQFRALALGTELNYRVTYIF